MKFAALALSLALVAPAAAQLRESEKAKSAKSAAPAQSAASSAANGSATTSAAAAAGATPATPAPAVSTVPPAPTPTFAPTEERQQLDKLTATNQIEVQKTAARMRPLNEERDEIIVRNTLALEKLKAETAAVEAEIKRLQLQTSLQDEKNKRELAELRQVRDRLRLDNEVAREKLSVDQVKADAEKLKMDLVIRDLDFQSRKLRADSELADHKTAALRADLELREKKDAWKKEANRDPDYALEPYKDGVLTITDRRIPLNGPILTGAAEYVNDRIDYFNNKDAKLPIFLVIDRSPGGSVMEGYRIVKAIRESKAPVHVVVKSYAASMAAVITTLAPRSYAYPNAVLLHHQMLSFTFGNITQQKEQLETLKEWYRRLAEPVARKQGLSVDAFTKKMYEHNSDGDWDEFADRAQDLKWVDHVVREVRETGQIKEPEDKRKAAREALYGMNEEQDSNGQRFVRLPRLQPYDAYWLYNRDGYYR